MVSPYAFGVATTGCFTWDRDLEGRSQLRSRIRILCWTMEHHRKISLTDAHYLRVARWSSLAITVVGFILGSSMSSVVSATVQFISILPFIGITFWVGVIWKRATCAGAWGSTVSSAVVFFSTRAYGCTNAWSSLYSLMVGFSVLDSQSALVPAAQTKTRTHLRLSGCAGWGRGATAFERRECMTELEENGHASLLRDLLVLHERFTFRRYRIDVLGFLGAWGAVCAFIAFYYWMSTW